MRRAAAAAARVTPANTSPNNRRSAARCSERIPVQSQVKCIVNKCTPVEKVGKRMVCEYKPVEKEIMVNVCKCVPSRRVYKCTVMTRVPKQQEITCNVCKCVPKEMVGKKWSGNACKPRKRSSRSTTFKNRMKRL